MADGASGVTVLKLLPWVPSGPRGYLSVNLSGRGRGEPFGLIVGSDV